MALIGQYWPKWPKLPKIECFKGHVQVAHQTKADDKENSTIDKNIGRNWPELVLIGQKWPKMAQIQRYKSHTKLYIKRKLTIRRFKYR